MRVFVAGKLQDHIAQINVFFFSPKSRLRQKINKNETFKQSAAEGETYGSIYHRTRSYIINLVVESHWEVPAVFEKLH